MESRVLSTISSKNSQNFSYSYREREGLISPQGFRPQRNLRTEVLFHSENESNFKIVTITICIVGFHVTSEKKLKLKVLSFYLYQVKVIFNHISVGLSSAR